ncbi:hypothetical protein ACFSO7_07915 [Bacillus sp. CGMCC 1.16607]|uniref:hypothetical protein n=1 Tax=Bacillus sp. CGMCC 1.16607 TaxID=3351842 RepID=UPI00363044B1
MEQFPIIHTNFWDAIIAVPIVIIITQLIKLFLPISRSFIPTIANLIGLIISIIFAHPHNLWAGIFMGFFYGNAAVGVYSSLKTSILAYRNKGMK